MNSRELHLPALATFLAALLVTPPAMAQKAQRGQAEAPAVAQDSGGTSLWFGVEGLTKDNLEKVTRSLMSMTEVVYVCSSCKHVAAEAGECPACDVEFEPVTEPVLSEVLPSFEEGSIRLTPFAVRTLNYSALAGVLTKNSIKIDGASFPLSGESRLVLRGGVPADVKAIEEALDASGFFERVRATYDAGSTEIRVVVKALSPPPMHESVAAVIDALDTTWTLVDVTWGPEPTPTNN